MVLGYVADGGGYFFSVSRIDPADVEELQFVAVQYLLLS